MEPGAPKLLLGLTLADGVALGALHLCQRGGDSLTHHGGQVFAHAFGQLGEIVLLDGVHFLEGFSNFHAMQASASKRTGCR